MWAIIAGFPVTLVGVIAGVWSAILAVRAPRKKGQQREEEWASPSVSTSGDIRQRGTHGITIAHTGEGEIRVTASDADSQ